jgi:hypothetical protein
VEPGTFLDVDIVVEAVETPGGDHPGADLRDGSRVLTLL